MAEVEPSAGGALHDTTQIAAAMKGVRVRQAARDAAGPEASGTEAEPESVEERAEPEEEGVEAKEPDAAEGESEAEAETEETVYEFEVDGKLQKFTEPELRASLMRQADYTRKTQELAEGRRLIEAEAGKIAKQRQEAVGHLGSLIQQLEGQLKMEDTSQLAALRETDPAEWGARMLERRQRGEALAQARYAYEQQQQQSQREHAQRELAALQEKTEWKDLPSAQKGLAELTAFACAKYGFSPQELENVVDHRFILLARDAQKHDDATRQTDVLKKKARVLPRVQPAGVAGGARNAADAAFKRSLDQLRATGGRSPDALTAAMRSARERHRR